MTATPGYVLVVNGAAGTAGDERVAAAEAVLAAHAPVERAPTSSIDELADVIERSGERVLVAMGGDGTLHALLHALSLEGVLGDRLVGLVPCGTGNDFCRAAGIPLDPAEAARQLAAGRATPVDILVDDHGLVVVNVVHAGLGAEAADKAEDLKPALGRAAYPIGALIAGVQEQGWDLQVEVDGRPVPGDGRVLMVGVGNGTTIGGGTPLCPDARIDDGLADVVVVRSVGPLARAGFAKDLRAGRHVDRDDVVVVRGQEVRVTGDAVRCNADGEVSAEATGRRWRVQPGAWNLVR